MELTVTRTQCLPDRTLGQLDVEGRPFCTTLEPHRIDWQTEQKTPGLTAIPEGRYRVQLAWSNHFRRRMPSVMDVPHFSHILIHPGNRPSDTEGCILVGEKLVRDCIVRGKPLSCHSLELARSRETFLLLYSRLLRAQEKGEEVWLTVQ